MLSRFTNLLCTALIGSAIFVVGARAQAGDAPARGGVSLQELEFRLSLTPEGWAKGAAGMSKCTVASPGADLAEMKWKTDSAEGVVSLPREFREVPLPAGVEGNRWIGADSSTIEIHGTHALYRGGMGMGGMDIGVPLGTSACAVALEGRPAPSHTMMLTRPAHGDTLYVDTPNTVIRNAVGLQFIILTHSPARHAQLLAAAQSLKVAPSKTP
ncbi:MAG: hypothetical protein JJD97_02990 [Gemmatimonadaceae bacterium]|nr:hypothetical protein [Gemmatimonadaceae bacterium]